MLQRCRLGYLGRLPTGSNGVTVRAIQSLTRRVPGMTEPDPERLCRFWRTPELADLVARVAGRNIPSGRPLRARRVALKTGHMAI
jgi:hypothetical protein